MPAPSPSRLDLVAPEHARAGQAAVRSQQVDATDGTAADRRPQGPVDRAGAEAIARGRNRADRPRGALGAEPGRRAGRGDGLEDARACRPLRAALDGPAACAMRSRVSRRWRRRWPAAPRSSRMSRSAASSPARRSGCPRAMRCRSSGHLLATERGSPDDIHMPLLLWWAIEAKVATDPEAVLALFEDRAALGPADRASDDRGAADAAVRRGGDPAGPGSIAPGCWRWHRGRSTSSG